LRAQQGRRRALGALAALGFATTGGLLGLFLWRETSWVQHADYATAVGERRRVLLPDGTELDLNTGSEVQVVFSPRQRRIVLRRGELFVRTGADSTAMLGRRSFWVESTHARFEALGTRFGVREREGQTRLSMIEGRVAIHAGDQGAASQVVAQAGESYIIARRRRATPAHRRAQLRTRRLDPWRAGGPPDALGRLRRRAGALSRRAAAVRRERGLDARVRRVPARRARSGRPRARGAGAHAAGPAARRYGRHH
jgi:transmembrane sensor